jgi:hypothetical protein
MNGFTAPRIAIVGRRTPLLYAGKVGHNEARRLSHAFGKDELNLGIARPLTRMRRTRAAAATMTGQELHAQYDGPALRVQSPKPVAQGSVNRCGQVVCSRALRPDVN